MNLPAGVVTFLFTDIEGSTRLWELQPEAMRLALARHDVLLRESIETNGGHVFKTIGDAFCAAFSSAKNAVRAALEAQRTIIAEPWPEEVAPLRVRMGLHTGEVEQRDNDYFGPPVNRVARLMSIAHGEQIVLSRTTRAEAEADLPNGCSLRDMGAHRLKDLALPERVWQIVHPGLPSEFPPLRSLQAFASNLPIQETSFIGREIELADLRSLLNPDFQNNERSACRLVTLVGSGGSGKTRLAIQAAADLIEQFKDGVWLVELAALSDPNLVPQAVAKALGLREQSGRSLTEVLVDHLATHQVLLLLDNCEHVVDASALLAAAVLRDCPDVTILATSREPLKVSGERVHPVAPFPLPDLEIANDVSTLAQFDAVQLFVDRAKRVSPGFRLEARNAVSIAQVCRRLDGIALGIELAAALTPTLTPSQIADRLDDRFGILTEGERAVLPRQQTLRDAIDWSYELLPGEEKALFRRLGIFTGSWSLDAVEAICPDEVLSPASSELEPDSTNLLPMPGMAPDEMGASNKADQAMGSAGAVLPDSGVKARTAAHLLARLVSKSLVVAEDRDESKRYRMLETVRAYARERMVEEHESDVLLARHREFYLREALTAEPHLTEADQVEWLNRLEDDHDNMRAVLSAPSASPADSLKLAAALWRFWQIRGHWTEGRRRLEETFAKALHGAGTIAYSQGDYPSAVRCLEESIWLRKKQKDPKAVAETLTILGALFRRTGERKKSLNYFNDSLRIRRRINDAGGTADTLMWLGSLAIDQGNLAEAERFFSESLQTYRSMKLDSRVANALRTLGVVAQERKQYALANSHFEEAMQILKQTGEHRLTVQTLMSMGNVARIQGDSGRSRSLLAESLAMARQINDRQAMASCLVNLAALTLLAEGGCADDARSTLREALGLYQESDNQGGIAASLEAIAALAVTCKHSEVAARLLGAAEALRDSIKLPVEELDRPVLELALAGCSGEEYASAIAEGRTMTTAAAVELAARTLQ